MFVLIEEVWGSGMGTGDVESGRGFVEAPQDGRARKRDAEEPGRVCGREAAIKEASTCRMTRLSGHP